jgi:exopolysaccharide biosynthesis polyprenyl glycosylphosphotransferase
MLKENWRSIARIERVADNLIIILSFLIAYYGRNSLLHWNAYLNLGLPFGGEILAPLRSYLIVLLVALPLYNFSLNALGAYSSMRLATSARVLGIAALSSLVVFLGLAATFFLLKIDLSRLFVLLFCVINTLALATERFSVLAVLRYWRRKGRNFRNVIIVGVGSQSERLAREIMTRPELGIRLIGFGDLTDQNAGPSQVSVPGVGERMIIRGVSELERALKQHAVDEVIFTNITTAMAEVEELLIICAEEGVRTTIAADLFSVGMVRSEVSYFAGLPLIHYNTPPGDSSILALKRSIDFLVSGVFLIILAPLFALLALAVRLSSPGSVFYKQKRVGLNGRIFSLYKFRSMHADADKKLDELRTLNEMSGPVFKMRADPRVTPVGRFLRRFSLDELPQLWNIFRGDMSLVGPRPPLPDEVHQYVRKYRRRLSMRPGLTCSWQVSGRSNIKDFDTWMKLDLDYIDNWSLIGDFKILCKTIPAVLFGAGAR